MADPIHSATAAKAAVQGALRKAAEKTGVGFDYLYRVAARESSLNPEARATTSSAAGLFQFIEQTWLDAVKRYGAAHGLAGYAADIAAGPNGRLVVADAARRREILDLRFDAETAAALAGEFARENKAALEGALGRAIDAAELYAAHFLGAGGAKKLLSARADETAATLLPAAAAANRHVFYDGERARSVGEVIDGFRRTIGAAKDAVVVAGERALKSLAPYFTNADALRALIAPDWRAGVPDWVERGRVDPRVTPGFEIKGLSPLVLAVLQALDPGETFSRERE